MRAFLLSALASLVLVTNLAAGVARGQADSVGRMVICTGHAPVMVYIDDTGAPTGPPVLCPDGVLALFDAVSTVPPLAAPATRMVRLPACADPATAPQETRVAARARAPPLPV